MKFKCIVFWNNTTAGCVLGAWEPAQYPSHKSTSLPSNSPPTFEYSFSVFAFSVSLRLCLWRLKSKVSRDFSPGCVSALHCWCPCYHEVLGYRFFLPSHMVTWSSNLDRSVCGKCDSPSLGLLATFLATNPSQVLLICCYAFLHTHPHFLLIPTLPLSWYQFSPVLVFNTSPVIMGRTQESWFLSTLLFVASSAIGV